MNSSKELEKEAKWNSKIFENKQENNMRILSSLRKSMRKSMKSAKDRRQK